MDIQCVVKYVKKHHVNDFLTEREIDIMQNLMHGNIIDFIAFDKNHNYPLDNSICYLMVFEYCNFGNLKDFIEKLRKPLPTKVTRY